jgi:hypothetical protein
VGRRDDVGFPVLDLRYSLCRSPGCFVQLPRAHRVSVSKALGPVFAEARLQFQIGCQVSSEDCFTTLCWSAWIFLPPNSFLSDSEDVQLPSSWRKNFLRVACRFLGLFDEDFLWLKAFGWPSRPPLCGERAQIASTRCQLMTSQPDSLVACLAGADVARRGFTI